VRNGTIAANPRVLFVDDENNVISAIRRAVIEERG
jgi:hypothetical protein